MFKGIQGILHKAGNKPAAKTDSEQLTTIKTAELLFDDRRRQELLAKFPKQLSLSNENYQILCTPLLTRVAEYMQNLPETRNSYYAQSGGLLDHALERTSMALSLVRNYFLPDGEEAAPLTQPQTLWAYAVFSASLLHDIGKLVTDFIIEVYDQQHQLRNTWNPFEGSMVGDGVYYDYDFDSSHPDTFKRRSTILLARQLMPAEGFSWIASNKDVLAVWLALLDDDHRGAGTLGVALWQADAQVINAYFALIKPNKEFKTSADAYKLSQISSTFSPSQVMNPDAKPGEASLAGMEFLKWIYMRLGDETLMLNRSPLFYVPGGLLMTSDIFKYFTSDSANSDFIRRYSEYGSWQAVRDSFVQLGVHQGIAGQATQTFINATNHSQISGIVLSNANLALPSQFKVMPPSSPAAIAAAQAIAGNISLTTPRTMTPNDLATSSSLQLEFAKMAGTSAASQVRYIATNGQMVAQPSSMQNQESYQAQPIHSPAPNPSSTGNK